MAKRYQLRIRQKKNFVFFVFSTLFCFIPAAHGGRNKLTQQEIVGRHKKNCQEFIDLVLTSNTSNQEIITSRNKIKNPIREVSLNDKGLLHLPRQIILVPHIYHLYLQNNSLFELLSLKHMEELNILDASNNTISSFPRWVVHLKKLCILNLSNNNLKEICDMRHMKKLDELYLHGNQFANNSVNYEFFPKSLGLLVIEEEKLTQNWQESFTRITKLDSYKQMKKMTWETLTDTIYDLTEDNDELSILLTPQDIQKLVVPEDTIELK